MFKNIIVKTLILILKQYTTIVLCLSFSGLFISKIYLSLKNCINYWNLSEFAVDCTSVILTILSFLIITIISYWLLVLIYIIVIKTLNHIKNSELSKFFYKEIKPAVDYNKNSHVIANINLINYKVAIEFIKNSSYGIHLKQKYINAGKLTDYGGKEIIATPSFIKAFAAHKKYEPTNNEKLEQDNEIQIYDIIFQEFVTSYGYIYGNKTIKDINYISSKIEIKRDDLEVFLRNKQLEIQSNLLL